MEFIFEPTYGDLFSMEVPNGLTILDIKDRIQALRRIHVSRQALFFEEIPLHDDDIIMLPPLSRIQLIITLDLPISPESMESPFPDDGQDGSDWGKFSWLNRSDKKIISLYLRVPALKIWASLEMDKSKDSVLGLKKKVEQLTEEIPTLGKKIEKLLQPFPEIKNKLEELRGNRGETTLIPWEMINLRIRNGSELVDSSRLLHSYGLVNQSEVIISLNGLPDKCGTPAAQPPPQGPLPTTNTSVALNNQEMSVWVRLELRELDRVIKLVVKATDKVGVIWYALKDIKIVLQKNDYFYFLPNDLKGGRGLNRELTFGSYSLKDGVMIEIVHCLTPKHQDICVDRLRLGMFL